jgi:hypothetical protein
MDVWTADELDRIGAADELQLASVRGDGTLGKPVTIWVVRRGDELFVRSVDGRTSHWFRGTQDKHEGHIRAGGVDKDVRFVEAGDDVSDDVEAAWHEVSTLSGRHHHPAVHPASPGRDDQARAALTRPAGGMTAYRAHAKSPFRPSSSSRSSSRRGSSGAPPPRVIGAIITITSSSNRASAN